MHILIRFYLDGEQKPFTKAYWPAVPVAGDIVVLDGMSYRVLSGRRFVRPLSRVLPSLEVSINVCPPAGDGEQPKVEEPEMVAGVNYLAPEDAVE